VATDGVGLTGVDEVVHPAIDNEAITTSMIETNNFFSIHISPIDEKMNQKRKTGPMKLKNCYLVLFTRRVVSSS